MKFFILFFIFILSFSLAYAEDCYFTNTNCNVGDSEILYASSTTNAHASFSATTGYQKVCCPDNLISTNSDSCVSPYKEVLRLSSVTNAHVEATSQNNYEYDLCINDNSGSNFNCQYYSLSNDCTDISPDHICVVRSDGITNAHIESCSSSNPYYNPICCNFGTIGGECFAEEGDVCSNDDDCCWPDLGLDCDADNQNHCCPIDTSWVEGDNPITPPIELGYCGGSGGGFDCNVAWPNENYDTSGELICCPTGFQPVYPINPYF
ncbi:hypothetical protein K8R47_00825 [archaeon]|nr:hypothetical protein [archaeon]